MASGRSDRSVEPKPRIHFRKGVRPGDTSVTYAFQCPDNPYLFDEDDEAYPCAKDSFITREVFGFNRKQDLLWLTPLITFESPDFLKPRYDRLKTIALEGFSFDYPKIEEDVPDFLLGLPAGFVKIVDGLGLKSKFKPLITQINTHCLADALTISKRRPSTIDGHEIVLSWRLFEAIRKSINRTHERALTIAGRDKNILVYNALFHELDPQRFPEKHRPYQADTVFKAISGSDAQLSKKDQAAALEAVRRNKKSLRTSQPEALMELHREIELVTLHELIGKVEKLLAGPTSERTWQQLFIANPFILQLAFNMPLIVIGQQFSVGGAAFNRSGDTVVDFLAKSSLTNNVTIIEIKAGSSKLRGKRYRDGLFSPHSDLAGSVTQVLDQRYELQKNIAQLSANSRIYDIESYTIRCLVIIGTTPSDPNEQKSFELFRSNIHGVQIVTFDELLLKLRQLSEYLSPELSQEIAR